jgi:hypothetical protein
LVRKVMMINAQNKICFFAILKENDSFRMAKTKFKKKIIFFSTTQIDCVPTYLSLQYRKKQIKGVP